MARDMRGSLDQVPSTTAASVPKDRAVRRLRPRFPIAWVVPAEASAEWVAEHARLIRLGLLVGWATILMVFVSTMLPHLHHRHMYHRAAYALAGVAAVVNAVGGVLARRRLSPRAMGLLLLGWAVLVFGFIAALTYIGGGFTSDHYVAFFPAVVFAATLLPPGMGVLGGLAVAVLYVGVVVAIPYPVLWGNILLRAGTLVATAAIASELAALERRHAQQRATSKAQAEARAAMLQEVHHRVKNDLQTVAELLSLEAERVPGTDVARVADNVISRVQSMAAVHRLLAANPAQTDATTLVSSVAGLLWHRLGRRGVVVDVVGDPIPVGVERGTYLALAINELVTNALRHAFPDGRDGTVRVTLEASTDEVHVRVTDDGVGPCDQGVSQEGLGLDLVRRLVTDGLGGTLAIGSSRPGTCAEIVFLFDEKARRGRF